MSLMFEGLPYIEPYILIVYRIPTRRELEICISISLFLSCLTQIYKSMYREGGWDKKEASPREVHTRQPFISCVLLLTCVAVRYILISEERTHSLYCTDAQ